MRLFMVQGKYTVPMLINALRSIYRDHPDENMRQLAGLNEFDIIVYIQQINVQLSEFGVQFNIIQGNILFTTTPVLDSRLLEFMSNKSPNGIRDEKLNDNGYVVLGCILCKFPITRHEIFTICDGDRSYQLNLLEEKNIIEKKDMDGGRIVYIPTMAFLLRYNITSLSELRANVDNNTFQVS